MIQIHERIKQARVSANLSEDEMAKKIGIERSTYQYWEKKDPNIKNLRKVAKALGKPDDYFFINHDEKTQVMSNRNKEDEEKKDHRIDDLIIIANKNADAVVSSTKSVERLTAMLESRSNSEREKNVSNLQNYAGLVAVIREIGIKAGYWPNADTAEKELNRFVALHKL